MKRRTMRQERRPRLPGKLWGPLLALVLVLSIAACGNAGGGGQGGGGEGGGGGSGDGPKITVGSKNFTEQFVLAELYGQALRANGFDVDIRTNLGSEQIADQALQNGDIDMYPEYTGTALLPALLDYKGPEPKTPEETYQAAKRLYSQREPADTMLQPADMNVTYGIYVRREAADQYGLKTLADLQENAPNLRFASYSEFQNRSDGLPNIEKNYGKMNFEDVRIVNDLTLRYRGIEKGEADVGVGFTTDAQLASDQLVVLEDPKNIWPFYYPAPVVRTEVLEANPKMEGILNSVSETLDEEVMRELNGAVDLEGEDPADVAHDYLEEQGLLEQQ
jgi:osmoprotectant transport system substrate-binding protein